MQMHINMMHKPPTSAEEAEVIHGPWGTSHYFLRPFLFASKPSSAVSKEV